MQTAFFVFTDPVFPVAIYFSATHRTNADTAFRPGELRKLHFQKFGWRVLTLYLDKFQNRLLS